MRASSVPLVEVSAVAAGDVALRLEVGEEGGRVQTERSRERPLREAAVDTPLNASG
jgi:hypothetical protein